MLESILKRIQRADALAILVLAFWPFAFYWQVALGQKVFFGDDITSLFFPLRFELARSLQSGQFPLWTVYLESGFPIFAEGHIAALDPINLLLHLLLPVYLALSYSILLRLALTGIGMYLFCRSTGLHATSSLLASFVFGFGGFILAHLQHLTLQAVAAWLPWLLLFQNQMQRARRDGQREWIVCFFLATLSIAIQLFSGFPQIALIDLIPFGLMSVVGILSWNRRENETIRNLAQEIGITIVAVGLGAGIAAAQLIPAAELLGLSVRATEMGAEFFTSYSIKPEWLTQFVSPYWQLGQPSMTNMEYWCYLGVLPIGLAFFAMRRRGARTIFFALLALGALIFTLGESTPIYGLLYYAPVFNRFRVPARFLLLFTFAALYLAAIGFEELQKRTTNTNQVSKLATLIGLALGVPILGLIVLPSQFASIDWIDLWTWMPWVLGIASAICIAQAFLRVNRSMFVTATLGLAAVDLVLFAQPFATTINPLASPADLTVPSRPVLAMDSSQTLYRVLTTFYNTSLRPNHLLVHGISSPQIYSPLGLVRNEDYLLSMSPAMLNLLNVRYYTQVSYPTPKDEALWGYAFGLDLLKERVDISPTRASQIEIVSYADGIASLPDGTLAGEITLTTPSGESNIIPIRVGSETGDWAYEGLLAQVRHTKPSNSIRFPAYLLSVRKSFDGLKYDARQKLVAPIDVTSVSARSTLPSGELVIESVALIDDEGNSTSLAELAGRNDFALSFKSHAAAMFENRNVMPRAFIVHQAELVADDKILGRIRGLDFHPEQVVLLSQGQALSASSVAHSSDQVTIAEYQSQRVKLQVKTEQPGYVVLTDSFYPGWQATLDGVPTPIERADYVFRAVLVPPGEHTIVFEFKPTLFYIGAVISVVCLVLGIVGSYWIFRRSDRASEVRE